MKIDRRSFATGLAAGVAELAALPFGAGAGAASPGAPPTASFPVPARIDPRAQAHSLCDSWLLRFTDGAPRMILHEASGLMFGPSATAPAKGDSPLEAQGIWRDYAPPYPLVSLSLGGLGAAALLRTVPPPAARAAAIGDPEESDVLRAAAVEVANHCLAQARPGEGDVWLMLRPTIRFGERTVQRAAPGGYGGRDDQSYPIELRAKLEPPPPPLFVMGRTDPASA